MDFLIYGGSFDPPHQGHIDLLAAALAQFPARVIVVPSHRNPLKPSPGAPASDRLKMLDLALRGLPAAARRRVEVSRLELSRGRSFTIETLEHFRKKRPDADLGLLVGSDCLDGFTHWKRWQGILAAARLVIGRRSGSPARPPEGARTRWLKGLFPAVSSSGVREALASGDEVRLPKGVLDHIRKRGLYDRNVHAFLQKGLKAERYLHTLEVVRMARRLAHQHGLDVERARKAALLHDAGRTVRPTAMAAYCRGRGVSVPLLSEIEKRHPLLLHAFISADLARRRFGVGDAEVLSAIRNHTLGAPGMGELDRLLYVADFCSEDREFPSAERVRELAFGDLDAAFKEAVQLKLGWALRQGGWIHPQGLALWNSLQNHP